MYNATVISHETRNNTYRLIKISKTTYEQQQEQREERNYMLMQKGIGVLLITICFMLTFVFPDLELRGCAIVVSLLIGLPIVLTKQHIFGYDK